MPYRFLFKQEFISTGYIYHTRENTPWRVSYSNEPRKHWQGFHYINLSIMPAALDLLSKRKQYVLIPRKINYFTCLHVRVTMSCILFYNWSSSCQNNAGKSPPHVVQGRNNRNKKYRARFLLGSLSFVDVQYYKSSFKLRKENLYRLELLWSIPLAVRSVLSVIIILMRPVLECRGPNTPLTSFPQNKCYIWGLSN